MVNPIVVVEQGKLQGKLQKSLNKIEFFTFKGIPYAKPPVGDLRFSIPAPPEPWEGVRDATKDCNFCAQFDLATKTVIGDEDCLYLNVHTPTLPSDEPCLPVMVFIHGGGFVYGSGTNESENGAEFLVDKGVVLVTINYRLGILGFLNLDCKEAPGNMGLRDQVQALKWVQKNISQFGGDPKNVTIFGVSAGGSSVEYLMLSPLAKGLFHKAIAQSGSTLAPWAHNTKIRDLAYKIPLANGKEVTSNEELLTFLKSLPANDLIPLAMGAVIDNTFQGGIHFGFVPSLEKPNNWEPFLVKKPYDILSSGEYSKVPFMSGFCTREGLLMIPIGTPLLEKLCKAKTFLDFLPFNVDEIDKKGLEERMKTIYLNGDKKFNDEDAFAVDFFTDVDFFGSVYVSATLNAKNNSSVYFYEFAYDGGLNGIKKKFNINRNGACHADDQSYLIKNDSLLGVELSETDKLVRDRLLELWTNFAKYGNPTPEINELLPTKWKTMTESSLSYLHIDENLDLKDHPYPARAKLFEDLFRKYESNS